MTREDAAKRYGAIVNGKWADESKHCVVLHVPEEISEFLVNTRSYNHCTKIYCNRDMAPALSAVFADIIVHDLQDVLRTFDGCFEVRMVRGADRLSWHSYALAVDFDAKWNRLGDKSGEMDMRIVEIFKKHGFIWGGDFNRIDKMHMEFTSFDPSSAV
jgi:hypothetical protein